MAIPHRGTTFATTYFVTAGTAFKKNLLQSDRMADLFCETLFSYRDSNRFQLHAFVVMPNHFHLILTVPEGSTLERAVQFIKVASPIRPASDSGCGVQYGRRVSWTGECVMLLNLTSIEATFIRIQCGRDWSVLQREYRHSSSNPAFVMDELPQRLKPVLTMLL